MQFLCEIENDNRKLLMEIMSRFVKHPLDVKIIPRQRKCFIDKKKSKKYSKNIFEGLEDFF